MGLRVSVAIAKNILRQISHDRRTVGMIVMMPLMFIFLFGYTFAGEPENIRTIVVNQDNGVLISLPNISGPVTLYFSEAVLDNIDTNKLSLEYVDDLDDALEEVEDGQAWAVIHFPLNFSLSLQQRILGTQNDSMPDTVMTLHLDGSNSQVASSIVAEVNGAIFETIEEHNPDLSMSSLINTNHVYGENVRFIDFFAPGIIGLITTMITIILTIVAFVRERTNGTLDRLFVSPAQPSDIVMGYTMTFSLIALFQSIELVAVASLLFNIAFVGSIFFALALIVIYAIGILGLGILLSTLAKNEFQAIQFVPLIFTPSILLAGILWPIESMPGFIRPVSSLIPLTYLADALRSVMIRGWGPIEVWVQLTFLVVFALLTIGASIVLLKIKSNRMGFRKK
ncbi:MAG: ABC-2 transporter permease [Thermoplasmata archaeon]|nr:ABC-2 transporter permease [Thermoplasmata archaeon]